MPNYDYRCGSCATVERLFLPISTDPAKPLVCEHCGDLAYRYMGSNKPSATNGLKTFAGDWFRKTYGHELGEDGQSAAEKKRDFQRAAEEHKKEA